MTISLIEIKNANYKEHSPITPIFSEAHNEKNFNSESNALVPYVERN